MGVRGLTDRDTVGSLTPTSQVTQRTHLHVVIQFAERFPRIAVTEVTAPAFRPAVDLVDHLADGDETPLAIGQFPDSVSCPSHRLFGRKCVEVATGTTVKVAVVPQSKSQEV